MTAKPEPGLIDEHAARWHLRHPEGMLRAEKLLLSPEQARLPKRRYLDATVLARERERLFARVWQVVCREESLPEPGDQLPYRIGDQEFVIVRQRDGSLRAFYNVCRHRGNLIRRSAGSAPALRCPYHGWCWELDGRVREIPDRYLATGIDDASYRLVEIACQRWGGFVFVNPAGSGAPPLAEYLGALPERLAPFRLEHQRLASWQSVELRCNWKVLTEAFLETYHVPGIHPSLVTLLDETNTVYERLGLHHRMWIPYGLPSLRHREATDREIYESWLREHFRERHLPADSAGGRPREDWEPEFDEQGAIVGERSARDYLIARQRAEGALRGHDYGGLGREQLIDVDHYLFFPNLVILAKADDSFLIRSRPHASDPGRCIADILRLHPPGHDTPPAPRSPQEVAPDEAGFRASFGEVISQDFVNVAGVQRGLHADALEFVTLTANDVRIRWFHDDIDAYLATGGAPEPG